MRMFPLVLSFVLLCSCLSTQPEGTQSSAQLMTDAKNALSQGDYDRAVNLFTSLRRIDPSNALAWDYLSQALLGRAGLELTKIASTLTPSKKDTTLNLEQTFNTLLQGLSLANPIVRSDLAESIRVLNEFNGSRPDYLRQNEFVYRLIYVTYLLKSIAWRMDGVKSTNIDELAVYIKKFTLRNNDDVVDIIHQLNEIINAYDSMVGKPKELLQKTIKNKTFTFSYKNTPYEIRFNNGIKNGLAEFFEQAFSSEKVDEIKSRIEEARACVAKKKRNKSVCHKKLKSVHRELAKLKGLIPYEQLKSEADKLAAEIEKN